MAYAGDSKSPALNGHEGSTPSSGTKASLHRRQLVLTHRTISVAEMPEGEGRTLMAGGAGVSPALLQRRPRPKAAQREAPGRHEGA